MLTLPVNPCCATALRQASRRLNQLYDNALAPCGLRSTQYAVLAALHKHAKKPLTIAALAEELVLDRSALSRNLDPLERDGYVTLRENPADVRSRLATLTLAGRQKLRQGKKLWDQAQGLFVETFGARKAQRLRSMLGTIVADDRFKVGSGRNDAI
jgi:DNA-binding MarR family transcriptional regulator